MVHDVSSSGQTIFVEPLEVVELNNRWREAQIEETREVERILDELSAETGRFANELKLTVESVARIDFAMAKARLAFEMRATQPSIWSQVNGDRDSAGHPSQRIRLRRARHPLLDQTVVPIDVDLGEDFRILLITGPNTGGKTVALKTVRFLSGRSTIRSLHSRGRCTRSCRFSARTSSILVTTRHRSESFHLLGAYRFGHRDAGTRGTDQPRADR
ncbi:MAG: hypothetical protein R2848_18320 [Thermomicrobiales bacterium]